MQIAGNVEHDFELLKSVIKVNNHQQAMLVDKALNRLGGVTGKTIALLGLSFKPNTDDMREAPSIVIADLSLRSTPVSEPTIPLQLAMQSMFSRKLLNIKRRSRKLSKVLTPS